MTYTKKQVQEFLKVVVPRPTTYVYQAENERLTSYLEDFAKKIFGDDILEVE